MTATDLKSLTTALTKAGLNPTSAIALDYIRKHSGTATGTAMATHLGVSTTTLTHTIDALERLHYAKRTKTTDRRKNPVCILPKGIAILKQLGIEEAEQGGDGDPEKAVAQNLSNTTVFH